LITADQLKFILSECIAVEHFDIFPEEKKIKLLEIINNKFLKERPDFLEPFYLGVEGEPSFLEHLIETNQAVLVQWIIDQDINRFIKIEAIKHAKKHSPIILALLMRGETEQQQIDVLSSMIANHNIKFAVRFLFAVQKNEGDVLSLLPDVLRNIEDINDKKKLIRELYLHFFKENKANSLFPILFSVIPEIDVKEFINHPIDEQGNTLIHARFGENQDTLLHLAVEHDQPDLVRLLIENKADVFAKNKKGEIPMQVAQRQFPRPWRVIEELAKIAARTPDQTKCYESFFNEAIYYNEHNAAMFLLQSYIPTHVYLEIHRSKHHLMYYAIIHNDLVLIKKLCPEKRAFSQADFCSDIVKALVLEHVNTKIFGYLLPLVMPTISVEDKNRILGLASERIENIVISDDDDIIATAYLLGELYKNKKKNIHEIIADITRFNLKEEKNLYFSIVFFTMQEKHW